MNSSFLFNFFFLFCFASAWFAAAVSGSAWRYCRPEGWIRVSSKLASACRISLTCRFRCSKLLGWRRSELGASGLVSLDSSGLVNLCWFWSLLTSWITWFSLSCLSWASRLSFECRLSWLFSGFFWYFTLFAASRFFSKVSCGWFSVAYSVSTTSYSFRNLR